VILVFGTYATRVASILAFSLGIILPLSAFLGQAFDDFQIPPHRYGAIKGGDAMSRLVGKIDTSEQTFGEGTGKTPAPPPS